MVFSQNNLIKKECRYKQTNTFQQPISSQYWRTSPCLSQDLAFRAKYLFLTKRENHYKKWNIVIIVQNQLGLIIRAVFLDHTQEFFKGNFPWKNYFQSWLDNSVCCSVMYLFILVSNIQRNFDCILVPCKSHFRRKKT